MSGRVSGGVFQKALSGAGRGRRTAPDTVYVFINDCNALGCLVVVSGVPRLLAKVYPSVRGGFFRNPLTGHSGRRHG